MSALTHLSKKPNARGRTIAWIELRDRVTAKLAAETIAAKKRGERVEPERVEPVGTEALFEGAAFIRANSLAAAILEVR